LLQDRKTKQAISWMIVNRSAQIMFIA
jgi:hypothetical protein